MESTSPSPQKQPSSPIIWIVIGLIIIAGAIYLVYRQSSTTNTTDETPAATTQSTPTPTSSVTSDADLQSANNELDKVDIDSIDSGLSQNDSDAANF